VNDTTKAPRPKGFPLWGTLAIPAGLLWGALLGCGAGLLFGNLVIGALIGAAIVIASGRM
jgi:hypothetical protein